MKHSGEKGGARSLRIDPSEYLAVVLLLFTLWALHVFFIQRLNFTGDEIRYVSYGLGVCEGEGFYASGKTWNAFLETFPSWGVQKESPSLAKGGLIHSVVYPLIGALAIHHFQLDGARWVSFGVGCLGMGILFFALRRRFPATAVLGAMAAILFSCPLLFYFRLFFSEIMLFCVNCLLLYLLTLGECRSAKRLYGMSAFLFVFPFLHLKMSLEAAVAFCVLLLEFRRNGGKTRPQIVAVLMGVVFFLFYLLYNKHFFGHYIGGASAAFPVTPLAIPGRIIINLFDYHHGIIANAPLMLLGFIGLLSGVFQKDAFIRKISVIFGAYFFTMLWANGSESYAARNWAAAMPFLAAGFAAWVKESGFSKRLMALPFLALSLCLTMLALKSPNLFLDNRTYALQYDALFSFIPYFHFGYYLPYDFLDHAGTDLYGSLPLGVPIFAVLALFAAGQLLSGKRLLRGAACQLLALLIIFFFSFVEEYKDVSVSIGQDGRMRYVNVKLEEPRSLAFVKIANPAAMLKLYGFLNYWTLEDGEWDSVMRPASVLLTENPFHCVDAILISETPDETQPQWLDTAVRAQVFTRRLSLFSCP